jgi:hypothetical protein
MSHDPDFLPVGPTLFLLLCLCATLQALKVENK